MSRENWCKHYNGTVNETCKAGVKYAVLQGRQPTRREV